MERERAGWTGLARGLKVRLLWATLAHGDFQARDKNGIKADSKGGLTRVLFNSGNLGVPLVGGYIETCDR